MNPLIQSLTEGQLRTDIPSFRPGDTVRVHAKVVEGNRERIQIFEGVVIARKGAGISENYTVRKISNGVGVEGKNRKICLFVVGIQHVHDLSLSPVLERC